MIPDWYIIGALFTLFVLTSAFALQKKYKRGMWIYLKETPKRIITITLITVLLWPIYWVFTISHIIYLMRQAKG